jgi:thioredoxin 1
MVNQLNEADFKEAIKEGNCVIDFWAPWCGPCKMISPEFEKLSNSHTGLKFFKVNLDDNENLATELKISSIPTFVAFENGVEVDRITGADKGHLLALVRMYDNNI